MFKLAYKVRLYNIYKLFRLTCYNLSMDPILLEKEIKEQRELIEKIFISVEKTRKYYLWTMWGTVIVFVLPLIALAFVIPSFMSTYSSILSGSTLGL